MWDLQLISCTIHMIMGLAAAPLGQPGRNGQARAGAEAGSALANGIVRHERLGMRVATR